MKYTYLILILLGVTIVSCKDDVIETTQIETIDFVPNPDSNDILDDYPNGVISFNVEGEEPIIIEEASIRVTPKETLLFGEYVDPNTGSSQIVIVGVKGFSRGEFKGNIISSRLLSGNSSINIDQADITLTQYGDVGELVSGNFSLEYQLNGNNVLLQGEFGALRAN